MTYRFIGKSLPRTEDLRLVRGLGRYTADLALARCAAPVRRALASWRSPHRENRYRRRRTDAGRATGPDRRAIPRSRHSARSSPRSSGRRRMARRISSRPTACCRASARCSSATRSPPCSPRRSIRPRMPPKRSRSSTSRCRPSPRPGSPPTMARATLAAIAEQYLLHPRRRRPQGGGRGAGRREAQDQRHLCDQPHHRRDDGAARRARDLRSGADAYTLYCGLQNPHAVRDMLANDIFRIPGNRIRLVAPDVGGGFGLKEAPFPEYVLAMIGAKRIGRTGAVDGRARRSLSFRLPRPRQLFDRRHSVSTKRDISSRSRSIPSPISAPISRRTGLHVSTNNLGGLAGVYRTPHIHSRVTGMFSNTPPTAPYRGAGRPEATYAIERVIDIAARRCGFDPVELRRNNLIAPDQMPYNTKFIFTYDSGEFERNMDDALELAEWTRLCRTPQVGGQEARQAARHRHRQCDRDFGGACAGADAGKCRDQVRCDRRVSRCRWARIRTGRGTRSPSRRSRRHARHRAARHPRALWRYRRGRIRHRHLRQPFDHHRSRTRCASPPTG